MGRLFSIKHRYSKTNMFLHPELIKISDGSDVKHNVPKNYSHGWWINRLSTPK